MAGRRGMTSILLQLLSEGRLDEAAHWLRFQMNLTLGVALWVISCHESGQWECAAAYLRNNTTIDSAN